MNLVAVECLDNRGERHLHAKKPKAKKRHGHNKPQRAEDFVDNDQVGLCANVKLHFHLTEPGAENMTKNLGGTAPTEPDDMRNTDLKRKMCENVSGNGLANADMQCNTLAVEHGGNVSVDMRVLDGMGVNNKRPREQELTEPKC